MFVFGSSLGVFRNYGDLVMCFCGGKAYTLIRGASSVDMKLSIMFNGSRVW